MHQPSSLGRDEKHRRQLWGVLGVSIITTLAEVIGAYLTGSLALVADAGHMLTDVAGVALSLVAMHLAGLPANDRKTFGYYRAEILAAAANALLLIGIAVYVLYEAYRRFAHPPEILGGWMMGVAVLGLLANLLCAWLLHASSDESLNVQGAYLEVLGDALGSVGVIVAGLIVLTTGWKAADPIIGVGIGLFILPRAWKLLRESTDILLEGTPRGLDLSEVRDALQSLSGVVEVHDLHAWSITKDMNALSGHLVVDDAANGTEILYAAGSLLQSRFGLAHSTLQVEPREFKRRTANSGFACDAHACRVEGSAQDDERQRQLDGLRDEHV